MTERHPPTELVTALFILTPFLLYWYFGEQFKIAALGYLAIIAYYQIENP